MTANTVWHPSLYDVQNESASVLDIASTFFKKMFSLFKKMVWKKAIFQLKVKASLWSLCLLWNVLVRRKPSLTCSTRSQACSSSDILYWVWRPPYKMWTLVFVFKSPMSLLNNFVLAFTFTNKTVLHKTLFKASISKDKVEMYRRKSTWPLKENLTFHWPARLVMCLAVWTAWSLS